MDGGVTLVWDACVLFVFLFGVFCVGGDSAFADASVSFAEWGNGDGEGIVVACSHGFDRV